jgi:hypothetical protein
LRLDLHQSPADLAKSITAPGTVESDTIKVSNRMTAHLSGPDFDITANTPETQAVSGIEPTTWNWTIKPKSPGQHSLYLDLDADFILDGALTPRTITTFGRTINVTVRTGQQFTDFAKGNWQWLWATILVPIVGWLWKRRHRNANADVT